MDDQGQATAADLQAIRAELADITVSLRALSTTLDTLAHGLARYPPGDLTPVLDEVRAVRAQLEQQTRRRPVVATVVVLALMLWGAQDLLGRWTGWHLVPARPRTVETRPAGKGGK